MTDLKPLAGLALCGLLLVACASEEPSRPRHGEGRRQGSPGVMMAAAPVVSTDVFLFLPYDGDHDHRITKSELGAAIAGAWQEIAGSRPSVRLLELQAWFVKLDGTAVTPFNPLEFAADSGDSVTRDDFAKALTRRFNALDRNSDGVLEPSEFMTIPRMERAGPGSMGPGGGVRRRGGEGGPY